VERSQEAGFKVGEVGGGSDGEDDGGGFLRKNEANREEKGGEQT